VVENPPTLVIRRNHYKVLVSYEMQQLLGTNLSVRPRMKFGIAKAVGMPAGLVV
jgi:hypothetical protein